jgi:hypothetical protein
VRASPLERPVLVALDRAALRREQHRLGQPGVPLPTAIRTRMLARSASRNKGSTCSIRPMAPNHGTLRCRLIAP